MIIDSLEIIPLWLLFLIVCLLTWLSMEGGYRLGNSRRTKGNQEKESPVGAMVGAILGLLAFMLAFTFSLAASRFDARRHVILDEANAIGTTWLRTSFLPEPQRSETAKLLKEYTDVRLRAIEPGKLAESLARSEELHQLLWAQAVEANETRPDSIMTGLFVQSLNGMIDLHATRVQVGLRSRIPASIWAGLMCLALIGMASVGYQAGLSATRCSPTMFGLIFAFACVLLLIADLDRPAEGFLEVSQAAMADLQRSMK